VQAFRLNGSRVLEIDLAGDAMRAATGAMIAYTGDVSFRNAGMGGGDGLRSALKRRVTGESISAGAQAVDRAGLPDPDRDRQVPRLQLRSGDLRRAADPGGPAGAGRLADCPSPSHHFDARWMSGFLASAMGMLGVNSGEERQFDFTGAGTVLIQSSERGVSDPHLLRQLEGQVGTLNQPGLPRIQQVVQERLQQQRR
jgi:uncharacterized protein (AIM24 family)